MKQLHEWMRILKQGARRHYILLAGIVILGAFLRMYQFHDWMTFNPDQARDAILVQNMIDSNHWPLMGPQAGNKVFKVGPIFYYFEITAARLFGATAEKMAYPDLLFSILAIILAYFFFRRFFKKNIALIVTFLFGISFFVVNYSRFAFNPNSIPFFTLLFLFALFKVVDYAPKEKLFWAGVLGIAMGVGFQLHAILFISMPLLASLTLGYLFIQKHFIWKSILVTLVLFLLFNTGQLIYEVQNNGANIRTFFTEAQSSAGDAERNYLNDFSNDILCHIQANTYIISSLGSGDKCNLSKLARQVEKKGVRFNFQKLAIAGFGTVFTVGGFMLFLLYMKKENDLKRKRALTLVVAYCAIFFLILFSVSSKVSMRYFIVIEFIPFLLAGFWIQFVLEKIPNRLSLILAGLFVIALVVFNMFTLKDAVVAFESKTASTDNVAYFGEVEAMSEYLLQNSNGSKIIYLTGKKSYLSRYGKPLEYFAKQQGVALSKAYNKEKVTADTPFFYVTKKSSERSASAEVIKGFVTEKTATFGNVTILKLVRKP